MIHVQEISAQLRLLLTHCPQLDDSVIAIVVASYILLSISTQLF